MFVILNSKNPDKVIPLLRELECFLDYVPFVYDYAVSGPTTESDKISIVHNILPDQIVDFKRRFKAVTVFVTNSEYDPPAKYYPYQYLMNEMDLVQGASNLLMILENHIEG